jgi:hypothetical protein
MTGNQVFKADARKTLILLVPPTVLREREQRNEQRCEGRKASCHGFVKESTGYRRGASVNFPTRRGRKETIPLPKWRMIRHNSR